MIDASATRFDAITTSDTVDLPYFKSNNKLTDYVYVGGAGDVVAIDQAGNAVTFKAVPVGFTLYIRVRRINASSTSATNLVACYES